MTKDLKIKNRKDAEAVLAGLAEDEAAVKMFNAYAGEYRSKAQAKKEALTAWVEAHPEELGPTKLLTLESGQIKMASSTSVRCADEEATLEYVLKHNLQSCFKREEKLILAGLKALDPDVQAAAGVEIVTEDKLSIKPQSRSPRCSLQFC